MARQMKFSGDKLMALEILADKLEQGLAMEKMEVEAYHMEEEARQIRLSTTILFSNPEKYHNKTLAESIYEVDI